MYPTLKEIITRKESIRTQINILELQISDINIKLVDLESELNILNAMENLEVYKKIKK